MGYIEKTIEIEDTNMLFVARAYADLSEFPEPGCVLTSRSSGKYNGKQLATSEAILFHKDTIDKDRDLFLLTQPPDIIVVPMLGDKKYFVQLNDERVSDHSLEDVRTQIDKLNKKAEEYEAAQSNQ